MVPRVIRRNRHQDAAARELASRFYNLAEPCLTSPGFMITIYPAQTYGEILVRLTCNSTATKFLREHTFPGVDVQTQADEVTAWASEVGYVQQDLGWQISDTAVWTTLYLKAVAAPVS